MTSQNTPARQQVARRAPSAAAAEQTVKDLVRGSWDAIASSLPETMNSKRFARLVFNAVRKTPLLAQATTASMLGSVLTASALGLEIGLNNEAHLVPYKRKNRNTGEEWVEAQLIIGYGGIVKLFQQHPMARGVASGWVGENDEFDYEYGTGSYLKHKPALGERGRPIAFWASYELANGTRDFLILDPLTVARLRSKDLNEKRDVDDPEHWMERKTVIKQVLKLAPKSTTLAWAMAVDEKPGGELQAERTHVAITAGDVVPEVDDSVVADDEDLVIDAETGEIPMELGEAGGGGEAPAASPSPAPVALRKATGTAIVKRFDELGVQRAAVDAWLPVLGVTVATLGELTQEQGEELLALVRGITRDELSDRLASHAAKG